MRLGITGAGGSLGNSLLTALAQRPGITVRALARRPPSSPTGDIEWQTGDLADMKTCADFVAGLDAICHFAHTNSPLTSDNDWAGDARLNLLPTLNLLSAIERAGTRPHFVYPSSGGAIYGPAGTHIPFTETMPCRPGNSYGIQKLMIEQYLRVFAERGLLDATVLRIGNAYGWLLSPDRPQGFIGTAINRIRLGLPVRLVGDPRNIRDYVHAEDVAAALLHALNRRNGFDLFNIGTGEGASVIDILRVLEDLLDSPVATEVIPLPGAERLPSWSVLDIRKAATKFGWSPRISLREGIARMLADCRETS